MAYFRAGSKVVTVRAPHILGMSSMPAKTASRPSAPRRKASHYPLDREVVDDLVAANRTLARLGVLDAFGHISVRDPRDPHRYFISRSIAPGSVSGAHLLALEPH